MSTTTTNYAIPKPAVNDPTDEDLWGTELNSGMDIIDSQLKTATDHIHVSLVGTTTIDNTYRNKVILCDATAAAFSVVLQPAATAGDGFTCTIKKTDATGNAVTIDGNAAETIDGALTQALNSQYDTYTITADGSNWNIKANKTTPTAVADASTTVKGILKLATNALAQAGTDALTAITPAALASLAAISGTNGKIVIGTITIQCGTVTGGSSTFSFPTAFSAAPIALSFLNQSNSTTGYNASSTASTVTYRGYNTATGATQSSTFFWIAIGAT